MRGSGHPTHRLLVALAALAALVLPSGAAAATLTSKNSAEKTLVEKINDVRADHGLRALRESSLLNSAATRHANSMGSRGYFRHELKKEGDWVSFSRWVHWYWPGPDYTTWTAGENLAWGAPDLSASRAITMWLNSPSHRANLLGDWKRVGVAVVHVSDPNRYYGDYGEVTIVVADFGNRT